MSRRALIEQYGKDIWVRDELGQNVNYDELRETPARIIIQPTDRYIDHEVVEMNQMMEEE